MTQIFLCRFNETEKQKTNSNHFMMMVVRTPAWTTVFENKGPKIQIMACCIGVSRNMSSWNMLVKALLDMLKLFSQNWDVQVIY